jgi:hypothetical protein
LLALVGVQVRCVRLECCARQEAVAKCRALGQNRLLLHERDPQAIAALHLTVIELRESRNNPQKRGFSGAIAADQADALAGSNGQLCTIEERPVAIGEV